MSTKYSNPRAPIVFIIKLITHTVYMKLTAKDAQRTLFSRNYDVGSADGDDDGDDVDFEHPASDGSFDSG